MYVLLGEDLDSTDGPNVVPEDDASQRNPKVLFDYSGYSACVLTTP